MALQLFLVCSSMGTGNATVSGSAGITLRARPPPFTRPVDLRCAHRRARHREECLWVIMILSPISDGILQFYASLMTVQPFNIFTSESSCAALGIVLVRAVQHLVVTGAPAFPGRGPVGVVGAALSTLFAGWPRYVSWSRRLRPASLCV